MSSAGPDLAVVSTLEGQGEDLLPAMTSPEMATRRVSAPSPPSSQKKPATPSSTSPSGTRRASMGATPRTTSMRGAALSRILQRHKSTCTEDLVDPLAQHNEDLTSALQTLQSDNNALEESLAQKDECLKELHARHTKLENDQMELVHTLQEQRTTNDDLQAAQLEGAVHEESKHVANRVMLDLAEKYAVVTMERAALEQELETSQHNVRANLRVMGRMEEAAEKQAGVVRDKAVAVRRLEDELRAEKQVAAELQDRLQEMEDLRSQDEAKISGLQGDVAYGAARLEAVQAEVSELRARTSQLETELRDSGDAAAAKEVEVRGLTSEIATLKRDLEAGRVQAAELLAARMTDAETRGGAAAAEAEAAAAAAKEEARVSQVAAEELRQRLLGHADVTAAAKQLVVLMREAMQSLDSQLGTRGVVLGGADVYAAAREDAQKAWGEHMGDAGPPLMEAHAVGALIKTRVEACRGVLEDAEASVNAAEGLSELLKADVAALQHKVGVKNAELDNVVTNLDAARSSVDTAKQSMQKLQAMNETLTSKLEAAEELGRLLAAQSKSLKVKLDEERTLAREQLNQKMGLFEATSLAMDAEVERITSDMQSQAEHLANQEDTAAALQDEIKHLRSELQHSAAMSTAMSNAPPSGMSSPRSVRSEVKTPRGRHKLGAVGKVFQVVTLGASTAAGAALAHARKPST